MASLPQLHANSVNAQRSTGPRSVEGKARVAQNALRHGLTAKHLVVRDEDREEFAELQDALLDQLAPEGAIETVTFQELLHAAWNLARFRRLEVESSLGTIDDLTDPKTAAVLDRLGRYQSRAQRAYYKALKELRTLQTNRALRSVKLDEADEPDVPAIVDINELTKQTQSEVMAKGLDWALKMSKYDSEAMQNLFLKQAAESARPSAAALALRL